MIIATCVVNRVAPCYPPRVETKTRALRTAVYFALVAALTASSVVGCRSSSRKRDSNTAPPPPSTAPPTNGNSSPPPPSSGGSRPPPRSPPPPPPPIVDCGARTPFDSDGDRISDPVERNNSVNNYADLKTGRCDDDPSRPVGKPSGGDLTGGLNLPDRGSGYRHYLGTDRVDTDDWGTLAMLGCLEAVGRAVEPLGISMGVGDLSLRSGGSFPPHLSHQNGLDVDMRYVRRDRQQIPLDLRFQPEEYDVAATKAVFEAFFSECNVEVIFVDIDRIDFTIEGQEERIVHVNGHSNHYHVRIGGS